MQCISSSRSSVYDRNIDDFENKTNGLANLPEDIYDWSVRI